MSIDNMKGDTKYILNSRVLLLGPPAVGKSSVARVLSEFGLQHFNLDIEVFKLCAEKSQSGPLPDAIINEATNRFIESLPKLTPAVIELPYHDYIDLFENCDIKLDGYDCIIILQASQQTLFRRNELRQNRVPELYIARCIGSGIAFGSWMEHMSMPWLRFDMDLFTINQVAAIVIDFLRRNESPSLSRLAITPNPCNPYIGGHLVNAAEWDSELIYNLKRRYSINTALDVGCGAGLSLDYFAKLGIRAWGLEGNIGILDGPAQMKNRVMVVDFTKQWIEWPIKMDLVWCAEVLEHIPHQHEDNVIRTICLNAAKVIFIAASPPDQPGYNHVNCRPKEYWIGKFEEYGLKYVDSTQKLLDRLTDKGPFGRNCLKESGLLFEVPL